MKLKSQSNRGRGLESLIAISTRNVISVQKQTAGVKWLGPGKVIPQKGPVDYVGTVCRTGRSIWFDAKESAEHRSFPLTKVPDHQIADLIRQGRAGAIAGLLVGATHPEIRMYLWLDWTHLSAFEHRVPREDDAWVQLGVYGQVIEFENVPGVS